MIIMHKNIPTCEIDLESWKIIEIFNKDHLPPILQGMPEKVKEWFNSRMLASSKIQDTEIQSKRNCLIINTKAMNLSDCYWITNDPKDKWQNVNLFDNNPKQILTEGNPNKDLTVEPIDKICGWKPKAWCIYNDERYLFKRSYEERDGYTDTDREIIIYRIMKDLGLNVSHYQRLGDYVISKTESNSQDKELITMKDYYIQQFGNEDCFLETLYTQLPLEIIAKINDMIIIDYIVNQKDRHYRNFGLLRDPNTLQIKDLYPIYDNGGCFMYREEPLYSRIIHKSEINTKDYIILSKKLKKDKVIQVLENHIENKQILAKCVEKTKEIL